MAVEVALGTGGTTLRRRIADPTKRVLTRKQKLFVAEYLKDLNATKAGNRAGYKHDHGKNVYRKAHVKLAINKAMDERAKRVRISADDVLAELFWILRSNVDDYELGDANSPIKVKEGIPKEAMKALRSVKKRFISGVKGGPTLQEASFELWDKPKIIWQAMKHLGMVKDRKEIDIGQEFAKLMTDKAREYDRALDSIAKRKGTTQDPVDFDA